jgi:hypothetical protein
MRGHQLQERGKITEYQFLSLFVQAPANSSRKRKADSVEGLLQ